MPNFTFGFLIAMAKARARTTPSPGTTITFGATSIQIPIAKIVQPIKSDINFTIRVSGSKLIVIHANINEETKYDIGYYL